MAWKTVTVIGQVKIKTDENKENRELRWQRQLFTIRPQSMKERILKNFKGTHKTVLGINPSISGTNTSFRKFVGDIGYHFSLRFIILFSGALHFVGLLLNVMLVYSFPHHLYSVIIFFRFYSHQR